jgi:hypothetical protein
MSRNRRKPKDGALSTAIGGFIALLALAAWVYFLPSESVDAGSLESVAQQPKQHSPKARSKQQAPERPANTTGRP